MKRLSCLFAGSLLLLAQVRGADTKARRPNAAPSPPPAPTELTWPLPPDPPRIRWVAQYSDLEKLKNPVKKAGWLDKLTGTKTADEKVEIRKPYGVTTDSRGRMYVADTELKVVWVIDPAAKVVERREGSSRAALALPVGVAIDAQDRLFVSDAALHMILCFGPNGEAIGHFGASQLGRPGGIAIDRTRNKLYVADAKDSRIAVFNSKSLEFDHYIGAPTKPGRHDNGTFNAPTNVAVDKSGNVYVSDTANYRVQIFDSTGKFLRAFGAQGDRPGEFIRPKGIAVDSEGHVYVADAEFNNFQILSAEGQPLLAVGALGSDPGQFALVAGLYIDSKDQVFTTEQYHGRVQVFQYISQPASADSKEVKKPTTH